MDVYIFPAVFEPSEAGGYCITFPDLPGCITEGDTLNEAMYMAKDALELFLFNLEDEGEIIPEPSLPESIETQKHTFVVPVKAHMPLIREEMANKSVKKTLTIPYWLNKAAESSHINFSQVLQFALKERLGLVEKQD